MLISFRYFKQVTDTKVLDRNFNFVRALTEPIDSALNRIKCNVEKELKVKSQKKDKKNSLEKVQKPAGDLQVWLIYCNALLDLLN